ncbi:MAG: HAMP domain-containing sensor histidine kinase, partial [Ekhidna sp.]
MSLTSENRFNLILLKFKEPLEKRYMLNRMDQDIYGFKLMFGTLLLVNPLLIFLDISRFEDPYNSIGVRFSLEVILIIIFISSHRIKGGDILRYQSLFFLSSTAVYLFLLAADYILKEDIYALFIPNVTTITVIINASFIGLRFRHSILINVLMLTLYTVYAYTLSSQVAHQGQVVYMFVFYIIATILSYLFERKNRELFLKNEEIEEKTGTILIKNIKLQRENDIKDSLISILSHDVKGPLTTLESLLKLKEDKLMSDAELFAHFDRLSSTVGKIRQFTERTILWVKSQMDGFKVTKKPTKIFTLISDIIGLLSNEVEGKQIAIENQISKDTLLDVDAEMFSIVIRNLLNNAVKFSNAHSTVTIEDSKTYNSYRIHVRDNGVGVPESKKSSIFTLDELVTEGTKKEKGTGLGLSLCYNIMKKLDGQLTFVSEENEGS